MTWPQVSLGLNTISALVKQCGEFYKWATIKWFSQSTARSQVTVYSRLWETSNIPCSRILVPVCPGSLCNKITVAIFSTARVRVSAAAINLPCLRMRCIYTVNTVAALVCIAYHTLFSALLGSKCSAGLMALPLARSPKALLHVLAFYHTKLYNCLVISSLTTSMNSINHLLETVFDNFDTKQSILPYDTNECTHKHTHTLCNNHHTKTLSRVQ